MRNLKHLGLGLLSLFAVSSCNIYSPLTGNKTDADHIEVADSCIRDGDFKCAKENYLAISNSTTRNEKLCMMSLSRAGLTLSALVNTVTGGGTGMLGKLANALAPWTADKQEGATDAQDTFCKDYLADSGATDSLKALFNSLAAFVHCATLLAKTDQFVATSDSDTDCNTAGNKDGTITKADITDDVSTGAIVSKGMCKADALKCSTDISSIDAALLTSAGLTSVAESLSKIPSDLKTSSQAPLAIRKALADTL